MREVSIIIPTYNEVMNFPHLIDEIMGALDRTKIDVEFIIVDDNSPDGTGQAVEELSKIYPIKVIHRAGKLGLGSAVIEGFKLSTRPYLGVMDGDMSHDPGILNEMILSLADHDISIGSRFEKGSKVYGFNLRRKAISRTGVFLTKLLIGVKDALSGYFFLRREVISNVELTTVGYKILLEILVKGKYEKAKEFPYTFRMRKFSTSKLNYQEFLMFIGQIFDYTYYVIKRKIFNPKKK